MDTARLPEIIREMYRLIDELEAMFKGRHFTPDGHTVGSIGEAIAAHYYGLELLRFNKRSRCDYRDAISRDQSDAGRLHCSPA